MALILTSTQQCPLSVAFKDANNNPARVDGVPTWDVSDPAILIVEPSSDGLSALVKARGVAGSGQVNVQADADLGSGVKPITGVLSVEVMGGEATVVEISAGTPQEQP